MKKLFVVFAHLLSAFATVLKPGRAKDPVAENLLLRQQLLILRRFRRGRSAHGQLTGDAAVEDFANIPAKQLRMLRVWRICIFASNRVPIQIRLDHRSEVISV